MQVKGPKVHIVPVSLTDWHLMTSSKKWGGGGEFITPTPWREEMWYKGTYPAWFLGILDSWVLLHVREESLLCLTRLTTHFTTNTLPVIVTRHVNQQSIVSVTLLQPSNTHIKYIHSLLQLSIYSCLLFMRGILHFKLKCEFLWNVHFIHF